MFTNILVILSFKSSSKILVNDQLQQRSLEAFHSDSGARASRSYICTRWITVWDRVDLKMEDHQEDLGILVQFSVFRSICKDQYSRYAQVHNTHVLCLDIGFSVFDLTNICFHEQLIKTSLIGLCIVDVFFLYMHA